jgi:hypothetical protein
MANTNTFTAVLDRILAGALDVLRSACVMPQLVNSSYSADAGAQGSTMQLSIPGTATASEVAPGPTPPDLAGVEPTVVTINLSEWWESGFFLSDKDSMDIRAGVIPGQVASCVQALADHVNTDLLSCYKDVYGFAGTPATTPFGSGLDAAASARGVLARQLCPLPERFGVIDVDAENNMSILDVLVKANERGDTVGLREGSIGRVLGIDWFMDQAVPTHTKGAATSGTIALDASSSRPKGTKTLHMDGFSVKPSYGDIFAIAGDTQTYTVMSATDLAGTDSDVTFEPGLKVAIPAADGNEVVTWKASHVANMVFNRNAFGFANRPFNGKGLAAQLGVQNPTATTRVMQDPVSKLSLRIKHTFEHQREKLNFDILYGFATVRPELACRIAG